VKKNINEYKLWWYEPDYGFGVHIRLDYGNGINRDYTEDTRDSVIEIGKELSSWLSN